MKIKYNDLDVQFNKLIKQNQLLSMQLQNARCYEQYFAGDVLNLYTKDQTEWLVNLMEKEKGRKIIRTHFIYKYDELNKTNFHKYIDGKENIVLLVKL